MLFAFMSYRQNFADTAEGLVNKGIEFRMLGLHLERLSDIVQSGKEEGLEAPISDIRQVQGRIDLEEIGFRYDSNEPFIFEDTSLSIQPGEYIAIAGPSGGGKTTLLKVMLGLLKPDSGAIRIDGLPLQSIGLRNWRAAAGVVAHRPELLKRADRIFSMTGGKLIEQGARPFGCNSMHFRTRGSESSKEKSFRCPGPYSNRRNCPCHSMSPAPSIESWPTSPRSKSMPTASAFHCRRV